MTAVPTIEGSRLAHIDHPSDIAAKRVNLAHEASFLLGRVEVRPARRELRCGDRAEVIEPRVMQVLVVLARANGEVVSRDDLLDQCWGGRIVTEDAVTRVLSQLRRIGGALCEGAFTVETVRRVGCRLVVSDGDSPQPTTYAVIARPPLISAGGDRAHGQQRIGFCRTAEGVTLAYSRLGNGPPLIKAGNFHSHLEHEIENPLWRHWIEELSSRNTLLRYDQRGTGMSDWSIPELNFDLLVKDLAVVVDNAGIERFDLVAISQGVPIAIAFAARYPARVGRMVLINGFATGWRHSRDRDHVESWEAMCTLARTGWGKNTPALRHVFTSQFFPAGTREQWDWWNELQKRTASPENAHRMIQTFGSIDVSELLVDVRVPTLVMHCKDDQLVSFEAGRFIASQIPGAEFVALDGSNHLPQREDASWPQVQDGLRHFLR